MEYNMTEDSKLQSAVTDELSWEPGVTSSHIGVAAKKGVVTLTGHVDTYSEKFAAEQAARRVKGVKAVAEELEVRLAFENRRDDGDIAAAAVNRLAWSTVVPQGAVQIKVEKGWVTLSGEVKWNFQRDAAANDVRNLFGVVGVSNQLGVQAHPRASDVEEKIDEALKRSWYFDDENVNVTVNGGTVHLTGTVHTPQNRVAAGFAAWQAAGTTRVDNDIMIV
jgi:osmotically-inducible protein OsmY